MISQSDNVREIFGYWPDFADAKIVLFAYETPATVRLELSYIDAELQRAAIVGLRFTGVHELTLSELLSENVLDSLTVSDEMPMRVELAACYGVSGDFICTGAEVTGVAPNHSFKPKPLRGSA
ncbi:Imm50 family immunity protein [Xanthomonas arboricola]|uniref:Imm50 family immunity protein n=1 Tax=Xanthomonas arboricola TaxID=56448 RepID=UPI001BAED3DC|nr:Imm50 family immunity protein [Xanthomonas arboricola]MDN0208537.1 Imm50 family immunity protein [Xanthomonas arboricola pv. corylina]MDN0212981.1 Imm50 family immunity protein [Xanthomonas arboricola pv. corylina]QUI80438.1 hypothetical protein ICA18_20100 [Xanthomonas arboricola pv. corylina]UQQ11048.1 immunity 50 family protein [Xanthomonas arboricola pv. corylina]